MQNKSIFLKFQTWYLFLSKRDIDCYYMLEPSQNLKGYLLTLVTADSPASLIEYIIL